MKKQTIRYSEGFKRSVVREIEEGKFPSIEAARKAYRIRGMGTITRWVGQYGNEAIQPKCIKIQTMKEQDELKAARKRIQKLEAALSDAHIDHSLEEAYLRIACERMETDAEAFKKKHAITLSDLRKRGLKTGRLA